jgi:hypothetical protein
MKKIVDKLASSSVWGLGIMQNHKTNTAVEDINNQLKNFYKLAQ